MSEQVKNKVANEEAEENMPQVQAVAMRVSAVSIIVNVVLSLLKLVAGIVAHSGAMISDAVHSASDVFSTIIVIIGIRMAGKQSDKEHPYGHERMECVAAIVLSVILVFTGIGIGYNGLNKIFAGDYGELAIPGVLALAAAVISIFTKEILFWYTKVNAKKIDSGALMADAWHHRSDSLSSIGALIGIGGARMGYPVLDPAASVVICLFIMKAAYDIFKDAVDKMVDKSCDDETEAAMRECIEGYEGVRGIDMLHTRVFGNKIYVDVDILVEGTLPLYEAHEIAEGAHDRLEKQFPKVKHIMIHVNPYEA